MTKIVKLSIYFLLFLTGLTYASNRTVLFELYTSTT